MFEKTLTDVVKGIRASKRDTALYISQCIAEIKTEISSSDMYVKANALQKLTFLQMMGYSMGYASFATIEVMSSPRFAHKRIGYLAASQGFKQDTEVILLSTNLLKKELRCSAGGGMHGVYEAGLAINCLSNIVTEDLARDLLPELTNLTTHPQPYVRKKAILCLFKLFVKYPQGLRLTFEKIQKCLDDSNPSVVSCAVNVITELSDKNPKNYLHLAPQFFRLLTNSSNNWMLIKVVKLLGSLVPEEPRLARKLLDPLAEIVRNTQAKSLLYEAVRTITLCLPYSQKADGSMPPNVPDIVDLCARTLRDFVEQADQNLKYLGLVGFGSLMQSHPRILSAPNYRPLILACLSDQDVTIRNRALDLVPGMASRKNLIELVSQLLRHVELASGAYKHNLVAKIVEMCSGEKYSLLPDFSWYLDILFQLGHMRGVESLGSLLCAQITDVALRVLPARPYAVRRSMEILLERDGNVSDNPYGDNGRGKHIMSHILPSLAWICGEYSDLIREALSIDPDEGIVEFTYDNKSTGSYHAIIQCLLDPMNSTKLSASTHKIYIQSAMKVFAAASVDKQISSRELDSIVETLQSALPVYMQSTDVEVMERSFSSVALLQSLGIIEGNSKPGRIDDSENGLLLEIAEPTSFIPKQKENGSAGITSKAVTVKDRGTVLSFLLKPSPMKPVGAKTQRKKHLNPTGVNIELNASVNLPIFADLLSKEESARTGREISIESVIFTQQHPVKIEDPSVSGSTSYVASSIQRPKTTASVNDAFASFQKSSPAIAASAADRRGDPFYLTQAVQNNADDEARMVENRFGTIQLLDSDDENDESSPKKLKKKKGKKSKSKSDRNDLAIFGSNTYPSNPTEFPVYEVEDDDFDVHQRKSKEKRRPGKEFEGLAKVDLLSPLREDEVMPERKHHEVAERISLAPAPKPSKKREKKTKHAKKAAKNGVPASVGDLLDLGDFGVPPSNVSSSLSTVPNAPSTNNAINLAFDDLLGLSSDPIMPPQPEMSTPVSASVASSDVFSLLTTAGVNKETAGKGKRPWMKMTVKSSSDPSLSKISIMYRPHRIKQGKGVAALIVFKIRSDSAAVLNNVTLSFPGCEDVSFGMIAQGVSAESEKVGPFTYSGIDKSQEVKGSVSANNASCTVKLSLPVSFHFSPENNLSLEGMARELVSPGWYSHSVKLDLVDVKDPQGIKILLCNFLRAAEVEGSALSPATGTYAAKSSGNEQVRILVKFKDNHVKVDIKSTNDALGKSLASDVKRLCL